MSLLRDCDPEVIASELRSEHRRLAEAFRDVPGFAPGPAHALRRPPWFLLFGPALERNAQQPVYRLIAELGTTFVLETCNGRARQSTSYTRSDTTNHSQPSARTDGLGERLASPSLSGVALSRDDIIRLTASLKLLRGPRDATPDALLAHLFRSATVAGVNAELSVRLILEFRVRIDRYSQWGMLYPTLALECWDLRTRASETLQLLAAFGESPA